MCRVQYFLACDSYSMFMLNEPQSLFPRNYLSISWGTSLRLVPSWFLDVVIHSLGPQLADSVTALRIMETKGAIWEKNWTSYLANIHGLPFSKA